MQTQKENVRASILSAALDIFYEKGFSGALIKDIARKAGIAAGNIYSYFSSKDELLACSLADTMEELDAFIARILKGSVLDSGAIGDIADGICSVFEEHRKAFMILITLDAQDGAGHFKRLLTKWIEARLSSDFFRSPLPGSDEAILASALSNSIVHGVIHIISECSGHVETMRRNVYSFMQLIVGTGMGSGAAQ